MHRQSQTPIPGTTIKRSQDSEVPLRSMYCSYKLAGKSIFAYMCVSVGASEYTETINSALMYPEAREAAVSQLNRGQ